MTSTAAARPEPEAPLAAKVFVAIVADKHGLKQCREDALTALIREVITLVPEVREQVFGTDFACLLWGAAGKAADLIGYQTDRNDDVEPVIQIECKAFKTKYNFSDGVSQLDRSRTHFPNTRCFVLMPEARAIRPGEKVNSPDSKGRRELNKPNYDHDTADDWSIVTYEQLAAVISNSYASEEAPLVANPTVSLIMKILRINDAT